MDTFYIPPSPNWFLNQILACTPDNILIYGSKNDIIFVHPTPGNISPKIEILPNEDCNHRVVCVDVTPKWDSPNKWILSSWEDNVVKIWDMKTLCWKKCSPPSKGEKVNLVGAQFLNEDRILNVFEAGAIVICHIPSMKYTHLSNIITGKSPVTCFAPCPHTPHIAAFGLKNGLIIVADLKKNGTLYKLRGHTGEVVNLSWCPAPINIFPQKPGNLLKITNDDDNIDKKERESNSNTSVNQENKGGKDTDETVISEITEESECANSTNITKPDDEDKELNEEANNSSKNDEATQEKTKIPDDNVEHNILIEKIENLITEAEEKSAKHKFEDISDCPEMQVEEKNSSTLEEIHDEEKQILTSAETQCSNSKDIQIVEKSSLNSEEKQSLSSEENKACETTIKKPVVEEPRKELLLASSGKDSTVNIWRAGSDGRLQCFFKLPEKKFNYKNKKSNNTSWIAIKWITPFSILVATKKGELLKYILPKPLHGKKEFNVVHNEHSSFIFVIAAYVPILTEENWFVENEVKIWTFSYDLFLLNTILDSKVTHLTSLETFCAVVNCMANSYIDPNRIALGQSNGTVKIWNAGTLSAKFFFTTNYSPKIYGKITSLDWHPTSEFVIAFSTEEGTIGLININHKHKATWFKQYFTSAVHKIQWGPYNSKTCLYAIGKGTVVCFDPDEMNEEPIRITLPHDTVPYYFAWKSEIPLMLLSTNCGKLICYDSSLTPKTTYCNHKRISLMLWHPDFIVPSNSRSFWVAAAVDNVLYILDFAEQLEKQGTLNIEDVVKTKFEVHYGNIKTMAWNHLNVDQLVTAAEDGLVHVLNVSNGTVVASYCDNRFKAIKAVMFNPNEEDMVLMTMSKCANFIAWKLSEHKGPLNDDILRECEKHFKSLKKTPSPQKNEEAAKKIKKIMKSAKSVILPPSVDLVEEKVKTLKEFLEARENANEAEESSNIHKLFGTKNDVINLLSCSEKSHINRHKFAAATTVSIFKGDLQDHILEAIEQHRVTPLLISIAPLTSISLWQKACETYADQMCAKPDSDPLEVALYFLACQNIERALEHLCEKEMFKEALALAKCKLPQDSVIISDIILRWAKFSTYCGNLETGALCYIYLGKYEEAVHLLFRRNDLNILSFALDLAKITGNVELIKIVEFRYNAFSNPDKTKKSESDIQDEENDISTEVMAEALDNVNEQISTERSDEVVEDKKVTQDEEQIEIEDEKEVVTNSADENHD